MSTKEKIKKIVKKIGEKAGAPLGEVLSLRERYKGYANRMEMVSKQVSRNVANKYGGGRPLAASEENMPLYKKEERELKRNLTKKNKKLLSF